jgi:hypothetical protein
MAGQSFWVQTFFGNPQRGKAGLLSQDLSRQKRPN